MAVARSAGRPSSRRAAPSTGSRPDWRSATQSELSPILSNALDAFYDHGYHGTSVRDIARRAGLTVPALYYHHANKEAILAALLDHSITEVINRIQSALADAGPDPTDRFNNLIQCLVLYMANHGKSAAMDAEIRSLGPDSRRAYSAKRRVVERALTTAIADGQQSGVFHVTSAAETSRAILGMVQAITVWYRPGGRLSPTAVADHYLDIARHTVGATI